MPGCLHKELTFGSGDYYIFCANPICKCSWIMKALGKDEVDVDLSNKGVSATLSDAKRVEPT